MKIWRFYLNKEKVDLKRNKKIWVDPDYSTDSISKKYPLYAITNDKEKAAEFINNRDSDLFILRKSKMTKDEWSAFANRNRSAILEYEKLLTRTGNLDDNGLDIVYYVPVLMPYSEKIYLDSLAEDNVVASPEILSNIFNSIDDEKKDDYLPHPLIFNYKTENLLRKLGYHDFYNWFSSNPMNGWDDSFADNGFEFTLFNEMHMSIDELELYIVEYGITYSV